MCSGCTGDSSFESDKPHIPLMLKGLVKVVCSYWDLMTDSDINMQQP